MIFSWPGEDLFEHGREVASVGECLFPQETSYYNALLGGDNWWRVAAALHDIGKANKRYQETMRKKPSFKCHEFLSAYYIWEALEAPPETRAALALTVMLHHHAMDRFDDCIPRLSKFEPVEEFDDYVVKFSRWLGVSLKPLRRVAVNTAEILRNVDWEIYRIAVIGVGPLVVADHIVSARRGNPTRLAIEICNEIPHRLNNCINQQT